VATLATLWLPSTGMPVLSVDVDGRQAHNQPMTEIQNHQGKATGEVTTACDCSDGCECDAPHWAEDTYGNEYRIDCGNGCEY
jgi:hypothetical protein